jgi:CRISPR system Cascade subunit CasD
MGTRHDRPGVPKRDYQTAGCAATDTIIKADGTQAKDGGVVSQRFYLADAAFLVGLECNERTLLERLHAALRDPVWPLALGRKSYVPSESIWMEVGLQDAPLLDVLARWPWIAAQRIWEERPEMLLVSFESEDGSGVLKMDQPLSSFAERRFGARFVRSEWIPFPQEVAHVPA